MSWVHLPSNSGNSPSTQVMEGSHSHSNSQDSIQGPSATLSGKTTPSRFSGPESQMAPLKTQGYGLILEHSTGDLGLDEWICSQRVSPVNLFLTPENGKESLTPMDETVGRMYGDWLARFDPESSCWRMSQGCLIPLEGDHHMQAQWLESFPKWGIVLNSALYQPVKRVPLTEGIAGGAWPTPNTRDTRRGCNQKQLATEVDKWPTPDASPRGPAAADLVAENGRSQIRRASGQRRGINLETAANHWPTPTGTERSGSHPGTNKGEGLSHKARRLDFPTPLADGDRTTNFAQGGTSLGNAARTYPTPTTMDALPAKSQEALEHEHDTARQGRSNPNNLRDQIAVEEGQRDWPTPRASGAGLLGGSGSREMVQQKVKAGELTEEEAEAILGVKLWPTPMVGDATGSRSSKGKDRPDEGGLLHAVKQEAEALWPTPNANEDRAEKYTLETSARHYAEGRQIHLAQAVRMWPTPTSEDAGRNGSQEDWRKYEEEGQTSGARLRNAAQNWPTPTAMEATDRGEREFNEGNWHTASLGYVARNWPTPTGDDADNVMRKSGTFESLTREVQEEEAKLWPTPRADDHSQGDKAALAAKEGRYVNHGPTLATAVQAHEKFPTPRSSEVAAGMTIENVQNRLEQTGYHSNLEESVAMDAPPAVQGSLSADWVEWLMNVPLGWTRLEPLPEGALEDWFQMTLDGTWFAEERGLPRIVTGQENRANRLKALGNGIVPACGALAITLLLEE